METQEPPQGSSGSLIRMRALKIDDLPSHQELHTKSKERPNVSSFVGQALDEAETYITSWLPEKFILKGSNKQSPPADTPVKLYALNLDVSDLPQEVRDSGGQSEAWFARVSLHNNEAKDGTASWAEFDEGLRVDHSQHEKDYTPDVLDAHEVMNWDEDLASLHHKIGEWEDVRVSLMEMAHRIPSPLNNRVFSVIVVTAKHSAGKKFIVVQIPVDTHGLERAKYEKDSKITHGMYCSVEFGELVEDDTKVRWSMATASDAKGALPMWMQKMGVPGAVVKDVGLFIGWCAKRRKGSKS